MGYICIKSNKECDGCMACNPSPHYYCPVCGEEVFETVFADNDGTILGCENCAHIVEPHEVLNNETN